MRCMNCGYDNNNENARFCQGCGSDLRFAWNPLANRMIQLLKDELFTALCVLYSISVGLSLISIRISIIGILMTIFLWMIFAQGRNGNIDARYMRCISGTIYAVYIVTWILCGIAVLAGLILAILFFAMSEGEVWYTLGNILGIDMKSYMDGYFEIFDFMANFFLLAASVILIVSPIIGMIFNGFGRSSIHRFAQSLYKNLENGQVEIIPCGSAQTWLMVYGVFNAIYASVDLVGGKMAAFLSGGCRSAALIIGGILVNKYFGNFK